MQLAIAQMATSSAISGKSGFCQTAANLANWVIFIGHIPNNVVALLLLGTGRYGFSDGADWFVFISGYTLAFVYAQMMIERGMVVKGASSLLGFAAKMIISFAHF
jgi:hypothetical protein